MFRFFWKYKLAILCLLGHCILVYLLLELAFYAPGSYLASFLVFIFWLYGVWFHDDVVPFIGELISRYKRK